MKYTITIECDEEEFESVSALLSNKQPKERPRSQKKDIKLKNPNSPATDNQKKTLKNMKYNGNVDELTQIEASQLIQEAIDREGDY